jgi:hypothetical protein
MTYLILIGIAEAYIIILSLFTLKQILAKASKPTKRPQIQRSFVEKALIYFKTN